MRLLVLSLFNLVFLVNYNSAHAQIKTPSPVPTPSSFNKTERTPQTTVTPGIFTPQGTVAPLITQTPCCKCLEDTFTVPDINMELVKDWFSEFSNRLTTINIMSSNSLTTVDGTLNLSSYNVHFTGENHIINCSGSTLDLNQNNISAFFRPDQCSTASILIEDNRVVQAHYSCFREISDRGACLALDANYIEGQHMIAATLADKYYKGHLFLANGLGTASLDISVPTVGTVTADCKIENGNIYEARCSIDLNGVQSSILFNSEGISISAGCTVKPGKEFQLDLDTYYNYTTQDGRTFAAGAFLQVPMATSDIFKFGIHYDAFGKSVRDRLFTELLDTLGNSKCKV